MTKRMDGMAAFIGLVVMLVSTVFLTGQAVAGNLEPASAPAPTMRTLEEVTSWNKIIPAAQRFVDALNGKAVLDKETGLVWEKKPSDALIYYGSMFEHCFNLSLDGRMGWRLPSMNELTSLFDTSLSGDNELPAGHPFSGLVAGGSYWSSTPAVGYVNNPFYVMQMNARAAVSHYGPELGAYTWCVRSR